MMGIECDRCRNAGIGGYLFVEGDDHDIWQFDCPDCGLSFKAALPHGKKATPGEFVAMREEETE